MCVLLAMSLTTLCFSTQGTIVGYKHIQVFSTKVLVPWHLRLPGNLVYLHASVIWMCFIAFLMYMVGMNGLRKCPG